jgi:hypothetical protein
LLQDWRCDIGGGGKGSSSSTKTSIRYAPYIEDHHKDFLNIVANYRDDLLEDSPFDGYSEILVDVGFFGTGYTLASFPSLFDMGGKFIFGLDVDTLFDQIFEESTDSAVIDNLVAAERDLLDDDIDQNVLPRFELGMRNLNAVNSSSFVIGKALIESARVKSISKFSSELRYRMIPVAAQRWQTHLEWNKSAILTYAEMIKLYFLSKKEITEFNYEILSQHKLWPFTVLEFDKGAIGALTGATTNKANAGSGSKVASALGGALSGAAAGSMLAGASAGTISGPAGMIGGAILGLAGGLF